MVSYLPNFNCFILRLDCTSLELLWMKKTRNFCVLLISRVRHLDSGIQVKGYFAAGLTRYPNSVLTFNIWKLIKCGDIDINPGPYQACSTSCKNRGWKFPCDVCTNPVCINQGIFCDGCTARKIAFTMHQMSGPLHKFDNFWPRSKAVFTHLWTPVNCVSKVFLWYAFSCCQKRVKAVSKSVCDSSQRFAKGVVEDICDTGQRFVKGALRVPHSHISPELLAHAPALPLRFATVHRVPHLFCFSCLLD